nr:long-chain fatty acid--CoA ligase [Streptomyces geranii]
MNIALNLRRSAAQYAGRTALRFGASAQTYEDLERLSRRAAGLVRAHGIRPGDRVGLMLPNVPEFAVLYFGILRAGGIVVPMNPLLKEAEVAHYLTDSGARLLFVWAGFREAAEAGVRFSRATTVLVDPDGFPGVLAGSPETAEVADRGGDDTAVILYTSGTTGRPKGAELTHAGLGRNIDIAVDLMAIGADDVVFGGLPLFHVFGQTCSLNAAVRAGACLTLLPRFDPAEAFEVLVRDRVTVFAGVPTMYVAFLNHPAATAYDLSRLRVCVSGGAAMPVEVMTRFEDTFACVVLEGYGLSETSPIASFNRADARRPGSIGTPVDGVEFRLVDDDGKDVLPGERGEIVVRGHNVMKGYWNDPSQTRAAIRDGWFHTGDIGRRDEDGFHYVVGRKKDMIIRGGYNVYPREIEEVLHSHPAVGEAAVVGVAHPVHGEEVIAVVSLRPHSTATPEELRTYARDRVAAYKYPRAVRIVDELPKGPTGKILKREIRARM